MSATTIRIPARLTQALAESLGETPLARWAIEAMVVEGVREGRLSTGEAGEFLGLGYFQAEAFLKAKGVSAALSDEEFAEDQADLREIVARARRV